MPSSPLVFCAPTLLAARRAAWTFLARQPNPSPLDPPLVLGQHAGASAWRDLAREQSPAKGALILPRLVTPDWYFARAHASNARRLSSGGLNRLWTLARALRGIENRLNLLDFDANDTEMMRAMAGLIARMRRHNLRALPVNDDPYGRELDEWRAAYEEELERLNAFDFEAAPALFPTSAKSNRAFVWPRTVVLDDAGEPCPALQIGLEALFSRAACVVGTLVLPGGSDEEVARRARAFWTKHGARFVEERADAPRLRLARALLDPRASTRTETAVPEGIALGLAHTPGDEAERVASHVRREIEGGARASDFCVVVPDPGASLATLRAAFAAAGVPLYFPSRAETLGSPLMERLMRLLVPRAAWSIDELHDLLGDGGLKLQWRGEDGQTRRLDAGRLRRASRTLRGFDDEAPWRNPQVVARDWEARLVRLRASSAGRGERNHAETLARSLDGGDLEGVAHLKELLAPLAESLTARAWEAAALFVAEALAGHWEDTACPSPEENSEGDDEPDAASSSKASSVKSSTLAPRGQGASRSGGGASSSDKSSATLQPLAPLALKWFNAEAEEVGDVPATASGNVGHETSALIGARPTPSASGFNQECARESLSPGQRLDERTSNGGCSADVQARAVVSAFRAGVRAVAERAGDEEGERLPGAWAGWLRLELAHGEDEEGRGAGVRVLGASEAGEGVTASTRAVFVVGLSERAWPRPRPVAPWPRATALALETLDEGEAPPLAVALHGLARLIAQPCPLFLSRTAWTNGAQSGASPLWEDLAALFPEARPPSFPSPDESGWGATTRAGWLRLLARSVDEKEAGAEEGSLSIRLDLDEELPTRLRALDAMRRERSSTELGRYDGVLGERGRALLQSLLLREEGRLVVSPSGLEGYARCPIRFFFERALGLPDESGTEDDLSRAESGDLVHRVLHAFHREWSAPLGLGDFEAAREFLSDLTRRQCESLGLPPILRRAEARRLLGTPERPGSLVRLLRAQCLEADAAGRGVWAQALHPLLHLERGRVEGAALRDWTLSQKGNGLEQGFRLPLEGALVQGRVDRMDASPDGSLVVVLDYKTGSASSLPSFAKGSDRLSFQLAVYVLAAGELTSNWQPPPRVAASYLSPRAGFTGWTAPPSLLGEEAKGAMSESALKQWLADSRVQIERIAALISEGTFNLSLHSAKVARCESCAQRAVCGQNAALQSARAAVHQGSDVVFLPERIEWENE